MMTSPSDVLEFPIPHKVSEVICISCGRRWIAVRPETVKLKDLECPCGHGNIIETGEIIDDGVCETRIATCGTDGSKDG
jgi:DNA-directed RNA polymerase subunit RPC12/RpoP